jgi:hypothetical protein
MKGITIQRRLAQFVLLGLVLTFSIASVESGESSREKIAFA